MNVLYITYDGVLEPLGQSQVLQYLRRLARDHKIVLLSYEKPEYRSDRPAVTFLRTNLSHSGIHWIPLRYHKRPTSLATAYDILLGVIVSLYMVIRYRVSIIHARSYPMSIPALLLKLIMGTHFIFDMRGLWADERVEGGIWKANCRKYHVAKWFERIFLTRADVVVSLTRAALPVLYGLVGRTSKPPRFVIIPTCADLKLFCPPKSPPVHRGFVLGHVGTYDTRYVLEPVLECFKLVAEIRPGARMLILSRQKAEPITEALRRHGISENSVEIKGVPYEEVARELARTDAAVFLLKPGYARVSACPTRLAELLGCGVPCLTNDGTGDVTELLEAEKVGVVVRDFSDQTLKRAVAQLVELASDPDARGRCVAAAHRHFSIDDGVRKYDEIYRWLGGDRALQEKATTDSLSVS
jgi:glycosyltransferase involved in cell wall biosynthesis